MYIQQHIGGSHRVLKNKRQVPVRPLYVPGFASSRLDVLNPIPRYVYDSGYYGGDEYGNRDTRFILSIATVTASGEELYLKSLKNVPHDVPFSPMHPSPHCMSVNNGAWPPTTPFIKKPDAYSMCGDQDFADVIDASSTFSYGGADRWYVDWESDRSSSLWADRMMRHIERYVEIVRPYRSPTHIYMDNLNLNVEAINNIAECRGVAKLRSLLHQYLGLLLIGNFSSVWPTVPTSEVDAISESVDGITHERPWNLHSMLKWRSTFTYAGVTSVQGLSYGIENHERLLSNGTIDIAVNAGDPYWSGIYSVEKPWTHNGVYIYQYPAPATAAWTVDLSNRFDAAMSMIVRPDENSNMFVGSVYNRKIGAYGTDANGDAVFIDSGPPEVNEWAVKDWLRWPSLFGAPTGTYSVDVVENGAGSYDTDTQTFVNCDAMSISREFENGTITVDVTAYLSDDVNIRYNAVNASLN